MKKYILFNNRGFSLVEVMVATGLLALMALAAASLSQISNSSTKYADQKNEQEALSSLIRERLKYDVTCRGTIGDTSELNLQVTTANFDKMKNPFNPTNANGGWEIQMKIPGVQAGTSMIEDTIGKDSVILGRRMKIDLIRLADGTRYTDSLGNIRYIASVYLGSSEIKGIQYQPRLVGTVTMTVDASENLITCASSSSAAMEQVCEDIGCQYDSSLTPPCQCIATQVLCATPGHYPTAVRNGVPDCRPLGGKDCDGVETYLVGVGIERSICSPAPTATVTTTTTLLPTTTVTTTLPTATTTLPAVVTTTTLPSGASCPAGSAAIASNFASMSDCGMVGPFACPISGGAGSSFTGCIPSSVLPGTFDACCTPGSTPPTGPPVWHASVSYSGLPAALPACTTQSVGNSCTPSGSQCLVGASYDPIAGISQIHTLICKGCWGSGTDITLLGNPLTCCSRAARDSGMSRTCN